MVKTIRSSGKWLGVVDAGPVHPTGALKGAHKGVYAVGSGADFQSANG